MSNEFGTAAAIAAISGSKVITVNDRKYCLTCYKKDEQRKTRVKRRMKDIYLCPVCVRLYEDKKIP